MSFYIFFHRIFYLLYIFLDKLWFSTSSYIESSIFFYIFLLSQKMCLILFLENQFYVEFSIHSFYLDSFIYSMFSSSIFSSFLCRIFLCILLTLICLIFLQIKSLLKKFIDFLETLFSFRFFSMFEVFSINCKYFLYSSVF